jgi:hypothetical protein
LAFGVKPTKDLKNSIAPNAELITPNDT